MNDSSGATMNTKLYIVFVIVAAVSTGEALKCYMCTGCGKDPFGVEVECNKDPKPACAKVTETAEGKEIVVKSCSTEELCKALDGKTANGLKSQCTSCTSDLCNASSSLQSTVLPVMLATVLCYVMYKRL